MNYPLVRRLTFVSVASFAAVMCSAGAMAAPSQKALDVLSSTSPAANLKMPAHARADSGVSGVLNAGALSAPVVELTLADGEKVTARLERVARDDKKGVQSWVGTFDDSPGSVLVLTKAKGVVTGTANYKDQVLEIVPMAGGKHLLYAVDESRLPQGDIVKRTVDEGGDAVAATSDYAAGETTLAVNGAVVQDLLVVYTAAAASKWGTSTLQSMIQSAVQSANQAYQNSRSSVTLSMVGLQQVSLREGSGMQATLDALTKNTEVRSLRDKLAADMVVLVSQDSDWCGYASVQVSSAGTDAYAVVWSSCLSSQSLAHEVGHLQGLDHNRENKAGIATYPYSYGYRLCTSSGFRDIMSYACTTSVPRVLNYSNPDVYYNGYATGIAYESDPSRSAETARTLDETAVKVAGFRVSGTAPTPTLPAAPSGASIQSAAYNKVTIGWTDNSTNETGFKVQRSADGVNFTEIATLGADTRTFADATVAARTTYYYRVRAYNSAGTSAFSNTVSVATPDVTVSLPPAPTGLTVQGAVYNKVTLGWTDNSTNETGFKVQRSTDGVNFALIATLGVNTGSFGDTTVAARTKYYYRVQSYNSAGSSGYANVVSVTTPDSSTTGTLPPAPTGITAGNNGDGTALVSWSVGTTTATSFEVRRQKWDSQASVWSVASVAATVPVSIRSIVDSVGAGTYRYTVRALNSYGASTFAGPATVTVTSSTSTNSGKSKKGTRRTK